MLAFFMTCLTTAGGQRVVTPTFATPTIEWMLSLGTVAAVSSNPVSAALLVEVDGFSGDEKTKRLYLMTPNAQGVFAANTKAELIAAPDRSSAPEWSPSGKSYAYLSTEKNHTQLVVREPGGAPRVVTHGKRPIEEFTWIDDAHVVVSYSKRLGCVKDCLDEAEGEPPVAYVADELLFRHWDSWTVGKRTVLAEVSLATGEVTQISSDDSDAPPFELSEPRDFAASHDGRFIVHGVAPRKNAAISNDLDLVLYDRLKATRVTVSSSRGADNMPRVAPDGRSVAFISQAREFAEADRGVLWLYDVATGARRALSGALDRPVSGYEWSRDARTIYFTVADDGGESLYAVDVASAALSKLRWAPQVEILAVTAKQLIVLLGTPLNAGAISAMTLTAPDTDVLLADFNAGIVLAEKPTFESIHVRAKDGTALQAWITRPAAGGKKLKTVVLVHGGPQGVWTGGYNSRWNAALFAGLGYIVVQPNPRGSLGFGQKFTDAVSKHWGAEPYDDIMAVTDEVVRRGDADGNAMCAAGASYGGYMVNWMAGHTSRFKCLISHAGVFDLPLDYYGTEELWSDEWDFGQTPWENPRGYAEFSPSQFVAQMKTPMLITTGELDYRVSYMQSLALFTSLRRRDVPARLVVFPGENHWVLSAKAKRVWWNEVSGWLTKYLH